VQLKPHDMNDKNRYPYTRVEPFGDTTEPNYFSLPYGEFFIVFSFKKRLYLRNFSKKDTTSILFLRKVLVIYE